MQCGESLYVMHGVKAPLSYSSLCSQVYEREAARKHVRSCVAGGITMTQHRCAGAAGAVISVVGQSAESSCGTTLLAAVL